MEKISILIPTYNVEKYIEETMESVINQSYSNLEIIIVDDCSTDKTFNLLKKYEAQDNRIKLFRNSKNRKICYTLNKALKNSTGSFIVRVDGDDICDLDRIEKLYNFIKKNKCDLTGTGITTINEKGIETGKTRTISNFSLLKIILRYANPMCHIWIARREVYEKLEGYREIPYTEDYDFLRRVIKKGFFIKNMGDDFSYKVRKRSGNTVSTVGIYQRKAFNYVQTLNKTKIKFKNEEYKKFIESTEKEEEEFKLAILFMNKAYELKYRRDSRWIYFFIKSLIKSKYHRNNIIRRALVKLSLKIDEKI